MSIRVPKHASLFSYSKRGIFCIDATFLSRRTKQIRCHKMVKAKHLNHKAWNEHGVETF